MSKYLNDLLADALAWATCEGCDDRADFFADELEAGLDDELLTSHITALFPTRTPSIDVWREELSVLSNSATPLWSKIARWMVNVIHTQYVNRDTRLSWLDWPTPDQRAEARAWGNLAAKLV